MNLDPWMVSTHNAAWDAAHAAWWMGGLSAAINSAVVVSAFWLQNRQRDFDRKAADDQRNLFCANVINAGIETIAAVKEMEEQARRGDVYSSLVFRRTIEMRLRLIRYYLTRELPWVSLASVLIGIESVLEDGVAQSAMLTAPTIVDSQRTWPSMAALAQSSGIILDELDERLKRWQKNGIG